MSCMKKNYYFFVIFIFFSFICPLDFFIIGDWNGYGIQGFFYRYQVSLYGISFVPIIHEIGYVTSGLIDGNSAISILLWFSGSCSFFVSFFIFLKRFSEFGFNYFKEISRLIFLSCAFLILSSIMQYGFFFSGPAGISILIGVPILICFGWIFYKINNSGD